MVWLSLSASVFSLSSFCLLGMWNFVLCPSEVGMSFFPFLLYLLFNGTGVSYFLLLSFLSFLLLFHSVLLFVLARTTSSLLSSFSFLCLLFLFFYFLLLSVSFRSLLTICPFFCLLSSISSLFFFLVLSSLSFVFWLFLSFFSFLFWTTYISILNYLYLNPLFHSYAYLIS